MLKKLGPFPAILAAATILLAACTPPPPAVGPETESSAVLNPAARFNGTWNKDSKALRYASNPPMRPEARAKFEALRPQDDPGARCVEPGTPRIMITPYPLQLVALDNHLLMVSEFSHAVRRIWTDTTAHEEDADPSFYGDSVVTWEGDTMIVSTRGYNGKNNLDPSGLPMSDALHMVERWQLLDKDTLQIEFTFDDPKNYTQPWHSQLTYKRVSWKLGEFSCTENNRNNPEDPDNPKGFTSTDKPAPYSTPAGAPVAVDTEAARR